MVRDLAGRVVGRTISEVDAPFAPLVVYPDLPEFVSRVRGRTITAISRRGKYAGFALDGGDILVVHRGMTGSLLLRQPNEEMESHVRIILRLDDGSELRFRDQRKFGKMYLMQASGEERPLPWARMGPEPLNAAFTARAFAETLARRTAPIKPLLLNQQIVAGLGNIYVDEALHRARIHPQRRANTLASAEVKRLHRAIGDVLRDAVERRGTTFSNYTDFEGRAGLYQDNLLVFHRTGSACVTCGTPIERLVVGGRGTHICPRCQRI